MFLSQNESLKSKLLIDFKKVLLPIVFGMENLFFVPYLRSRLPLNRTIKMDSVIVNQSALD